MSSTKTTLGQLADLGFNDPGVQRIDPKAIERLLFGERDDPPQKKQRPGKGCCWQDRWLLIVYFQQDDSAPENLPTQAAVTATTPADSRRCCWRRVGSGDGTAHVG